MINAKRILLYLPLYLVWAVTIDVLFDSASPPGSKSVPAWMTIGFVVSAVVVAGVVLWYLSRHAAGKVPQQRQHVYTALLVAIIVSGFVDDALKGAAWLPRPSSVVGTRADLHTRLCGVLGSPHAHAELA